MTIRKFFRVPQGYKITRVEETVEDEITINIEPYKRQKGICSGCRQIHQDTYRGTRIIKARDLPACGKKVYLNVTKRRYLCPKDGKLYIEEIDWLKKKEDIPEGFLKRYIA
ncbi:MAG: transposase [Candidatus Omnitrophica bacterium]|nr:transposase [Candidatus Omnitrophota bacterium]